MAHSAGGLAASWIASNSGQKLAIVAPRTSFRQWADHLAIKAEAPETIEELSLWTSILRDPGMPVCDDLIDSSRNVASARKSLSLVLPTDHTKQLLTTVPKTFHGSINDVLLTALALSVCEWRHQFVDSMGKSVLVDLEGHGREDIFAGADVSRTMGWFTSRFPVRLDLSSIDVAEALVGGPALGQALKIVKEHLRSLPNNGLGYGLLRYMNPQTRPVLEELERFAKPQISFNYLGRISFTAATAWGLDPEIHELAGTIDPATAFSNCLEINAVTKDTSTGPQLSVTWSSPKSLLSEEGVSELAQRWNRALDALITYSMRSDASGFTPSDLALTSLTQEDIDELESAWRDFE